MSNSDLRLQLIKEIVDSDDAFLKQLNGFINIDENRLEIVEELIEFNDESFFNKIKGQIELYELIKEERKHIKSSYMTPRDRFLIERVLIVGKLKKLKHREIVKKIEPFEALPHNNTGDQRIGRDMKVFNIINNSEQIKDAFFKGIIAPDTIRKIFYENEGKCNFDEYLEAVFQHFNYDIDIPITETENYKKIELKHFKEFNGIQRKWNMPTKY